MLAIMLRAFTCALAAGIGGSTEAALQRSTLALVCTTIHVSRRLCENLFVHAHSATARMPWLVYFGGLSYYLVLPSLFITDAVLKVPQGPCTLPWPEVAAKLFGGLTPLQVLGLVLFVAGNACQFWAHYSLAQLRSGPAAKAKAKGGYSIPRGWVFKHNSNPHYFWEIVLYCGFVTASESWGMATGVLMGMVVTNLLVTALSTHRWYLSHFPEYPKERWAMIPFVI